MSTDESGSRKRAAATKRERTNRVILAAARTLFDQYGYHGVKRDDVAKLARVGTATIFSHYPTKQALAIAAYAPSVLRLMADMEKRLPIMTSPEPYFTTFIWNLAVCLAQQPAMAVALLPLSRDSRSHSEGDEATHVLSFRDLAEFIGKLLMRCTDAHAQDSATLVNDIADFALSGLLTWIVQHPERPGKDAADLMLAHLL
ncbi:TetR family transcriptional regulator [Streptomyces sp. NBC_01288]|uniref:TetR/AcrR family transcriptional regulator n=1 Tax=Streptomyces sp. NBC_01288 TaxID=2903814 RepID=UPI002E119A2D|nr:TetR family transcriptional regulator [Streptomyces sp. NBC_01288]